MATRLPLCAEQPHTQYLMPITLRPSYPMHRIAWIGFLCMEFCAQYLMHRILCKNRDTILCSAAANPMFSDLTLSDLTLPDLVSSASPALITSDYSNGASAAQTRFLMRHICKKRKKTT